ncbi:nucleoside hydrolase [Alteromonas ponticola]|uniref:Nucleoside hydrolase n=1 Tax=Alteromonas aquimaris TaxID=2998417 RepID=A0ABT3P9K6_9ALTE|nr:nucleoside hydrolase [Alteromonas aquimaris]MCW8108751.1 nucleoside hydrolase [Alteromonas aquimaris]
MQSKDSNKKKKVIFDHDGGIDDLLSLLLLVTMEEVELVGVLITPADCYPDDALLSTLKILTLTNNASVPVAVGTLAGLNPFPPDWRAQPKFCHALPVMLRTKEVRDNVSKKDAHSWLAEYLSLADEPVTILMTGPATNLAKVIHRRADLRSKIEQVIWMAGAIQVKGNVAMHDSDGSQEWNAYWDPLATKTLIESGVNLCLVPLDVTNALPIDRQFLTQLSNVNSELSELAGQFWAATTTSIPSYEFTYFMWDILATALLGLPKPSWQVSTATVVVDIEPPRAGAITCDDHAGYNVTWLSAIDEKQVREYVIDKFSRGFNTFFTNKC